MSFFDETISSDSFQAGSGTAGTLSYEALDSVLDIVAFKCVYVFNTDDTDTLLVTTTRYGNPGSEFAIRLEPGNVIKLPLRHPARIRVAGLAGTCSYSWCAL